MSIDRYLRGCESVRKLLKLWLVVVEGGMATRIVCCAESQNTGSPPLLSDLYCVYVCWIEHEGRPVFIKKDDIYILLKFFKNSFVCGVVQKLAEAERRANELEQQRQRGKDVVYGEIIQVCRSDQVLKCFMTCSQWQLSCYLIHSPQTLLRHRYQFASGFKPFPVLSEDALSCLVSVYVVLCGRKPASRPKW